MCVSFCCTTSQISHNYTYITSLLSLPPLPASHPLVITEHQAGPLMLYHNFSPAAVYLLNFKRTPWVISIFLISLQMNGGFIRMGTDPAHTPAGDRSSGLTFIPFGPKSLPFESELSRQRHSYCRADSYLYLHCSQREALALCTLKGSVRTELHTSCLWKVECIR